MADKVVLSDPTARQLAELIRRDTGRPLNIGSKKTLPPALNSPGLQQIKPTSGPVASLYTCDLVIVDEAGVETVIATGVKGREI